MHTQCYQEQQEEKRLQNRFSPFFENLKVGTLLSGSGIRKPRRTIPLAIFSLPFG
jgi:hypothetical protein